MLPRLAGSVRVIRINMNQPIASESALSDEGPGEFRPLIRVKLGVAPEAAWFVAGPPERFAGAGIVPGCHPRRVKEWARQVKSNLPSRRFQQERSAV